MSLCYAKSLQSCPTLCDPIDGSPPGSPVPGILQARTLEWVSISFSNAWKWKVKVKSLSRVLSDPMDCSLPGSSVHGISIPLYKSRECVTTGVIPKVNYGPWGIKLCQCSFISCKKCITLMGNVDNGYAYMGGSRLWEIAVPFSQFCFKPKTSLKE